MAAAVSVGIAGVAVVSGDTVAGLAVSKGAAVASVGPAVVLGAGGTMAAETGMTAGDGDCCSGSTGCGSGVVDGVAAGVSGLAAGTVVRGDNKGVEGVAYGEATYKSTPKMSAERNRVSALQPELTF